jgi:hypothetical protein
MAIKFIQIKVSTNSPENRKTIQAIRTIGTLVPHATVALVKKYAGEIEYETQRTIWQQIPPWAPLSADYLRRKYREGFDTRILLRSHLLVRAIATMGLEQSKEGVAMVVSVHRIRYPNWGKLGHFIRKYGFPKTLKEARRLSRRTKFHELDTEQVMSIHEESAARKRPVFEPTYARIAKQIAADFEQELISQLGL